MTTIRRLLVTLTLALFLGLSAACGNDSDGDGGAALPDAAGASSSDEAPDDEADLDPEDAMLKFAQCMREHGVDMPDPEPGGGIHINGEGIPEEQVDAAHEACQKWMDMAMPEDGGRELTEEEKQSFLDMAACMRDRGYDFPDPEFDGGRVTQRIEKGADGGPGPEDPGFEEDRKACEAEAGIEPPEDAEGGSLDEQEG
ncbi:hypothetical protein [Nocardioides sp.]|uniref:hypothetical protein n=1 Tax=Nocardioides sp. TaxID=35761 RepID=UPI001A21FFBD|nr:hypothetical protein [Nocardioides sp.]MBJ7358777.1 hypothetical protein [Nocardioides sp.]